MKEQKSNPVSRIWQIAESEHGRLLLSVLLAVLGVLSGIVPFVSAAKIISGMIEGNTEWSYYLVFVIAAFAGFVLKTILYAWGLSVSHKAAFSILGEIRKRIFAKLPRMPLGTIIDTSSGKLKKVSDAERYKALGNGICLPFWTWMLKRISAQYERSATLGSFFDGISSFPLIWERLNGEGTCLFVSEIDEFCTAVSLEHFGGKVMRDEEGN